MKEYQVLYLIGRDRPGIVDDVSSIFFNHNANIEDSRAATMGGCFSIMILFACPSEEMAGIKAGFSTMRSEGFESHFYPAHDPMQLPRAAALPLKFEITAMDHPGIVQGVVKLLRNYGVNIVNLDTCVIRAPLSGAPLFDLRLQADVPADQSVAKVKGELERLAEEQNLDLNFIKQIRSDILYDMGGEKPPSYFSARQRNLQSHQLNLNNNQFRSYG